MYNLFFYRCIHFPKTIQARVSYTLALLSYLILCVIGNGPGYLDHGSTQPSTNITQLSTAGDIHIYKAND